MKIAGFIVLALILGVIGLSLVFSDLGPAESWAIRIVIGVLFFLISGAVIGFFNPNLWVLSGLTAWGGMLWGGILVFMAVRRYGSDAFSAQEPPYISVGLITLLLPMTISLVGGFIGQRFGRRRTRKFP